MEVFSTRLGKNIEIGVVASGTEVLLDSWSLTQFLQTNEDVKAMGVHISDTVLAFADKDTAVYAVTIKDNDGNEWTAIGEANPSNLENEISKKYPHTMARKRAVDRAIIEFFGLNDGAGKRLYSENEIYEDDISTEVSPNYAVVTEDFVDDIPIPEEYIKESAELLNSPEVQELLGYKVKGGNQKGKTIKILMETNRGFIDYVLKMEPDKIKNEGQKELFGKVMKLKELGVL